MAYLVQQMGGSGLGPCSGVVPSGHLSGGCEGDRDLRSRDRHGGVRHVLRDGRHDGVHEARLCKEYLKTPLDHLSKVGTIMGNDTNNLLIVNRRPAFTNSSSIT